MFEKNIKKPEYKKRKSYKVLRVLYVILFLVVFAKTFFMTWQLSDVGTCMSTNLDMKILSMAFPILLVFNLLILEMMKFFVVNIFYIKNKKKAFIFLIISVLLYFFSINISYYFRDMASDIVYKKLEIERQENQKQREACEKKCEESGTSTPCNCYGLGIEYGAMTGKPVVYLYPEKEIDVNVKVNPVGGLTMTDPEYGNGWFVKANPNGKLYNYKDKNDYPYLFWEGWSYKTIDRPEKGFVIKKENLKEQMKSLLFQAGLSEKEIEDYLEFWYPKMSQSSYVFVTFVSKEYMDSVAPLEITPKPDSVIRVFTDYTLLDEDINIEPQILIKPERKGFTVVEWGGALYE